MDGVFTLILQQAFGGTNNEYVPDAERENELKVKTGILAKKLNLSKHTSLRLIEDVANLLVLLQDEPDERISLLTTEDLEAIASSVPPLRHKLHHETEEEEITAEKKVADLGKRTEELAKRMYPTASMTEASLKKDLDRKEREVLAYINNALSDGGFDLRIDGPLRTNESIVEAAKAISDLSNTFETRDKGVYVVSEHETFKDKAGVHDDVSVVLTKVAESQRNAFLAGGRPFQEALLRVKEECVRNDAIEHHDQSLEYLEKNVKVDWRPSMPTDLGYDSEASVQERVFIGEQLDRLNAKKKKIMALHKRELDEIVNLLKEHNKKKFMRALQKVRREADEDQRDVEKIVTETFKTLEAKSAQLNNKYTSLFQKARSSIVEQFESSRNALYRGEDNTDTKEGGEGSPGKAGRDPFLTVKNEDTEKDSGNDGGDMLLPWKVAVERDLTKFNMDIIHSFEADNSTIFSQHAHEMAAESKEKVDKYLKF
jgi:hypothetical protein